MTARSTVLAGARAIAGDGLLHPVPLVAITVLVVNDQVLKAAAPGWVTGKLSDVAGLVFFPLFIVALGEVIAAAAGRWHGPRAPHLTIAVAVTGLAFALVKLLPAAERLYEAVLGIGQWPFAAVASLVGGSSGGLPPLVPVNVTRDPTDLVALAALWLPMEVGLRRARGVPAASAVRPYDLIVGGLSVALLAGATLDGWAHSHELLALESIVTPWHAVVYLGFTLVAFVLLAPPAAAWLGGGRAAARAAIPDGYGYSVAGVCAFALTGVADAAWHLAFGIEANTEALLSPTHLTLGAGAALIASGPLRAAWLRQDRAVWPGLVPAMLSVVAIVGVVAFALHVANLFVDPWPRYPYEITDLTWYGPNIGVASAIVPTVILIVPTLLLLRRWPELPIGTMTILIGGTMAGLTFLHDQGALVGAPVLAGFVADLLLIAIRPGRGGWRLAAFAFLVPAVTFVCYFVVLWATGRVAWSAHLIGGTIAIVGGVGWGLALLASQGSPARTEAPARE